MKLQDLREHDQQLDEILPAIGAAVGGAVRGAGTLAKGVGSAVSQGAKAVGNVVSKGANVAGQIGRAANLGGLEGGATDPAAQAQQVASAKKEVQDQIKQKQAELQALQQQLTQIK